MSTCEILWRRRPTWKSISRTADCYGKTTSNTITHMPATWMLPRTNAPKSLTSSGPASNWFLETALKARTAAARYLKKVAGEFPKGAQGFVSEAATLYEQETSIAAKLLDLCRAKKEKGFDEAARGEAADLIQAALKADRAAAAKLEAALAAAVVQIEKKDQ